MKTTTQTTTAARKNYYFTQVHEDAIISYTNTVDRAERTQLYTELIRPAFNEMVNKIIYTYKFTSLPNIDSLREECKVWLTTVIEKFNPSKGSKAFSYFSVITKNWFIHKVKKNAKQNKREIQYDELPKDLENEYMSSDDNYLKMREEQEFWGFLATEIYKWDREELKDGERKVLQAVKILFETAEELEAENKPLNKKAIYHYIREITGLNTKQVVNNLNKMRARYKQFRISWIDGNL